MRRCSRASCTAETTVALGAATRLLIIVAAAALVGRGPLALVLRRGRVEPPTRRAVEPGAKVGGQGEHDGAGGVKISGGGEILKFLDPGSRAQMSAKCTW